MAWEESYSHGAIGKILKRVEKYSKVVDTAVQSNPQVSALVWAGIRAIMQVLSRRKGSVDTRAILGTSDCTKDIGRWAGIANRAR